MILWGIGVTIAVVCAALFIVFILNQSSKNADRDIYTTQHPTRIQQLKNRIHLNSKINEDAKQEIIFRCLDSCQLYSNSYFYKTTLPPDEWNIEGEQYKERGIEFEMMVSQRIDKLLDNNPDIQYFYQWRLGGGICDFAMVWDDCYGKRHSIIIECKHSDSRDPMYMEKQINDGMKQLNRYSQIVKNKRRYAMDLVALLVDFPIPGSSLPIHMRQEVMIFHVSMLEEFIAGVIALKNKQSYVPPKEAHVEAITTPT